jgi:hypothetical protein
VPRAWPRDVADIAAVGADRSDDPSGRSAARACKPARRHAPAPARAVLIGAAMKKTRKPTKLTLDRNTVAVLSDKDLPAVNGGLMSSIASWCPPTWPIYMCK